MILNDRQIKELAQKGMLIPYIPDSESVNSAGRPITSRGQSSFGYDLSLGNIFKRMKRENNVPGYDFIDLCEPKPHFFVTEEISNEGTFVMKAGDCVLAVTRERISIPRDVLVVCMQKSSIARNFLEVTVTPGEPEWEGYLTLELHNKTTWDMHLRPGMGITQMLFLRGELCETSYADRKGKYQDQPAEPVTARAKT